MPCPDPVPNLSEETPSLRYFEIADAQVNLRALGRRNKCMKQHPKKKLVFKRWIRTKTESHRKPKRVFSEPSCPWRHVCCKLYSGPVESNSLW